MNRNKHLRGLVRSFLMSLFVTVSATLPAAGWDYSVTVSGNTVNVYIFGLTDANGCCAGATIDSPAFAGASCSIPCGGTQCVTLGCNSVGTHALYVYAADGTTGGGYEYRQTTVTISDPPPPTCPQFQLIVAGSKVLTHQYFDALGATIAYPQGQTADSEMKVSVRTIAAPVGTIVYLKVGLPRFRGQVDIRSSDSRLTFLELNG